MLKYKYIIYFILVVTSSLCEELTKKTEEKASSDVKPQENIKLRRSLPYSKTTQTEPSLVSKLGSWLFPSRSSTEQKNDDQTPAAAGYSGPHYLPAPYDDSTGLEQDCHSCNQIPWIPVIGQKPLEYASSFEYSGHPEIHSGKLFSGPEYQFSSPSASYDSPTPHYNSKANGPPSTQQLPAPGNPPAFKDSINIPVSGDIFIADYMLPPPINLRIPSLSYGRPKETYGLPTPTYGLPKPVYGVPQNPRPSPRPLKPVYGPPSPQYGPPSPDFTPTPSPGLDIRLPVQPEYGPPKPQYGPPPADGVLPPPRPTNGSFPNPQYGPPRPFPEYGPPPTGGNVPPPRPTDGSFPNPQYAPPRPFPEYGPPPTGGNVPPPRPTDGSFPNPQYGPPRPYPEYGPPPADGIVPPPRPTNGSSPNPQYGPPRPFPQYGTPSNAFRPPNQYGPPARPRPVPRPGYGPPNSNINPPVPRPQYNIPPQSSSNYLPPPNYGPPPVSDYGAPPQPSYGPPNVTPIPVLLPPPATGSPEPQVQFLHVPFESIPTDQGHFQISSSVEPHSQLQLASSVEPAEQNPSFIPPAVPSDSYGNAVTGDSLQYTPPTDTVYSSSSDRDIVRKPPNFSNFNQLQYEFRNYNEGITSQNAGYQSQNQQSNNVEIQPSVQVANYLASVEHPVSVVQSPLFEVSVKDEHHGQNSEARPTSSYDYINEGSQKGDDHLSNNHASFKLSENPIVVEDTYTASSNINSSFTNSNDTYVNQNHNFAVSSLDELNDIKATSSAQDEEDLIKKLLLEQGILGNPSASIVGIQKADPTSGNYNFTPPSTDYGNWIPTHDNRDSLSTSMVPPAENIKSIWPQQNTVSEPRKPLQIIVPYTTNKQQWHLQNDLRKTSDGYTTLIPTYMPPMSTEESNWSKFLEDFKLAQSNQATARPFTKPTTAVYNIKDLLTSAYDSSSATSIKLPYDVISLQKNIDDWTHQSFSRTNREKTGGFAATKNIPNDFFSIQSHTLIDSSTPRTNIFDHAIASSNKKESVVKNEEIETNMIADEDTSTVRSTTVPSTTSSPSTTTSSLPSARKFQRNLWDEAQVTVSPYTKEKVYLVTPQSYSFYTTPATAWSMAPKVENGRANNAIFDSQRFAVRFEPQDKDPKKSKQKEYPNKTLLKVVYSEWPHIINNLQTTTEKPTSSHPLLGSMSIPEYVPPLNFSALETIVGYSKVSTVATSPSTPKKLDEPSESSTSVSSSNL
ncbi:unnamed protein product [Phaedon cochleariae]|uniref:Uncharacterized protein n=1 Tax=Phaedon cochleariae TaxID=80249 RepID=A0A9P0GQN2_PHACE|nr:unnamed protein product [Phaedon cochleariae]